MKPVVSNYFPKYILKIIRKYSSNWTDIYLHYQLIIFLAE